MNTLYIKSFLSGIFLAFLLAGCQDDDDLFSGQDNFITALSLEQGGTAYHASFLGDSIIVTVPDNVSLKGATVSYTLSENASVKPDPASVSNWDEEMLFAVKSWNGTQKTYRYTINRNSIDTKGTVVLSTQEEVDAFGELGVTSISGNLIIGQKTGADSITSLAALYQLKEVAYSLVIHPTYAAGEIVGLDALKRVGGEINITSVEKLSDVEFPGLEVAGSISFTSRHMYTVAFPALVRVTNRININCPLNSISFPALQQAEGALNISDSYSGGMLSRLSFPMLKEAGSMAILQLVSATRLEAPELEQCADLNLSYLNSLEMIYFPKLREVTGKITFPTTSKLTELSFPALEKAGGLDIRDGNISSFDFPSLAEISNDLFMQRLALENLDCFGALTAIGGTLEINNFSNMKTFTPPPSLKRAGKLAFSYYAATPPEEIDLSGMDIGELSVAGSVLTGTKIKGDDEFNGTLTIDASASVPSGKTAVFPSLEGFSVVDSLSFGGYISYLQVIDARGIRKIKKGLRIPNGNEAEFYMPDLEEVGGDFIISSMGSLAGERLEFPKLQTIAGNFDVAILSMNVRSLSFPMLESVGGYLELNTGYVFDLSWAGILYQYCLSSVSFPSLNTINGRLTIQGNSDSESNNLLTNLDGFSALISVAGVEVTGQSVLVSYEGLKNALPSFTADGWDATNNAYNPTYEELSSGTWVQP